MAVADSRVLLVRHAPTTATRDAAFPADEPLDPHGQAATLTLRGLRADHVLASPLRRCRETVEGAGWRLGGLDPRWAELDFGTWAGRSYDEVARDDPDALAAWQADPVATPPPDGETLQALADRTIDAVADLHDRPGTTAVVTSGGPIKVAVLHALGAPLDRLWNVDVAPLSVTELRPRPDGGWTLRAGSSAPVPTSGTVPTSVEVSA